MNIRLNLCTLFALSINFIFLLFLATPRSRFKVAPSSFILGIFWALLFLISIATLPFVVIVFSVTSCGQCTCVLRGLPFFSVVCCCCCININPLQPLIRILFAYDFEHTHARSTLSTQARAQSPLLVSLFLPIRTQFYTHTLSLSLSLFGTRFVFAFHFISFVSFVCFIAY